MNESCHRERWHDSFLSVLWMSIKSLTIAIRLTRSQESYEWGSSRILHVPNTLMNEDRQEFPTHVPNTCSQHSHEDHQESYMFPTLWWMRIVKSLMNEDQDSYEWVITRSQHSDEWGSSRVLWMRIKTLMNESSHVPETMMNEDHQESYEWGSRLLWMSHHTFPTLW